MIILIGVGSSNNDDDDNNSNTNINDDDNNTNNSSSIWSSLNRVLETGVFARPDKCLTGMRKPWLSDP